jgi:anti-sigma regulatory factor (Ser/Thr protein kinase)
MAESFRITRAAYLEILGDFRVFLKEHCAGKSGVSKQVLYDLQLAVDEACTNIATHGYAGLDPGSIILDLELASDEIIITLTDFGHAFEPSDAPPPDVDAPLDERKVGGLGLFLIKQSVDQMDYRVTEDGNKMVLTKKLT